MTSMPKEIYVTQEEKWNVKKADCFEKSENQEKQFVSGRLVGNGGFVGFSNSTDLWGPWG